MLVTCSVNTECPLQSFPLWHLPVHWHPVAGVAEQQGLMRRYKGYAFFLTFSHPLQSILGNFYYMEAINCVGSTTASYFQSSPLTATLMFTKFRDLALSLTCCYFDLRSYHWMCLLRLAAGLTLNPSSYIWASIPRS